MSIVSIKLTEEQFKFLEKSGNWIIDDIPQEYWTKIPGIQRLKDTIAIMGSANIDDATQMHSLNNIIAGIDVLISESHPKSIEPAGNAYHYVFQQTNEKEFPYKIYGPYKTNMKVPHWFDFNDLENYWKE